MLREVVLDFETMGFLDLPEVGAWRYAEDPTTDAFCASVTVLGVEKFLWTLGDPESTAKLKVLAEDPNTIFVAHNAGFEKAIWRKIMVPVHGFKDIPNSRWHDTMAVCAMRRLPLDLEMVARVLELPEQKDTEGHKITLGLSKLNKKGYYDRSADKIARSGTYCMQDSATEVALLQEIGYLPEGERDVWLLDQRVNERGVAVDPEFVRRSLQIVAGSTAPLLHEFRTLTGDGDPALGINPTQRDKVMAWVEKSGYWLPDLKKDTLAKIAGTIEAEEALNDPQGDLPELPPLPPTVARAMRVRSLLASASIKKLSRMEQCVGLDGRARGLLQYHAAGPGRWGGRLIQPQNFPRGTVKVGGKALVADMAVDAIMTGDHEYVKATLGEPIEVVASSLRHALVPGPGREFHGGDFSSIEARLVLAIAGQHDKTALLSSGADVYVDMAIDIFKMERIDVSNKVLVNRFKDEHNEERQIGKNTILGCGFQMGWFTFRSRYCQDRSEEFAKRVIDTYRKEWAPEVPKLWSGLEYAALETVLTGRPHEAYGVEFQIEGRWMTARLHSGRKLWYFNPKAVRKTMAWSTPEKPDVRMAWTFQTMKMGRWITVDAYGGIITENVVQGDARDLMVAGMFKCEKNGLPVVLTVHDSIIIEPLKGAANADMLRQIMCDIPDWARQLKVPVAAECWTGDRMMK